MTQAAANSVFDAYAAYYDLLYRDKDYAGEAAYVHDLLQHHRPGSSEILELGCGSGRHALELSRHGYRITGIDRSPAMIAEARKRAPNLSFQQGDLRDCRLPRKFDVVLALFHVMSYQVSNADLQAAFATAANHLNPGGLFLFDFWYGPAVLHDPPVVRVKRLADDSVRVTRVAEPVHYPNENRVDVHYELLVESPAGFEKIKETHPMRYLFLPEIKLLGMQENLTLINHKHWLKDRKADIDTWNVCCILGKQ